MSDLPTYPAVLDPRLVGTFAPTAFAGGGHVWDAVLEYRVWCHPERGAPDEVNGSDYYYAFATYEDALVCWAEVRGAEEPLALVLQEEFIAEPEPGRFVHMKEPRVTEWPVECLVKPRRRPSTIPDFLTKAHVAGKGDRGSGHGDDRRG